MTQLSAWGLTIAIEAMVSVWIIIAARCRVTPVSWATTLAIANLTHPLLWWALTRFEVGLAGLLLAELLVAIVESVVWRFATQDSPAPWLVALALGLGCNAASFGFGLISFV